jgi:hypothetical protein
MNIYICSYMYIFIYICTHTHATTPLYIYIWIYIHIHIHVDAVVCKGRDTRPQQCCMHTPYKHINIQIFITWVSGQRWCFKGLIRLYYGSIKVPGQLWCQGVAGPKKDECWLPAAACQKKKEELLAAAWKKKRWVLATSSRVQWEPRQYVYFCTSKTIELITLHELEEGERISR